MSFLSCWDGTKTTLRTKLVVCCSLSSSQRAVVCFAPNMPKLAKIWRSPLSGEVLEASGEFKLGLDHFLINACSSRILDLIELWQSIIKAQHLSLPFQNAFLMLPFTTFLCVALIKMSAYNRKTQFSFFSFEFSVRTKSASTQTLLEKVFHVGNSGLFSFFFFFLRGQSARGCPI